MNKLNPINRSVAILKPRQPILDWLNALPDNEVEQATLIDNNLYEVVSVGINEKDDNIFNRFRLVVACNKADDINLISQDAINVRQRPPIPEPLPVPPGGPLLPESAAT